MDLKEAKALYGEDTLEYVKKAATYWEDQVCKACNEEDRDWATYKMHTFKAYEARHEAKRISDNKFNFRDDYRAALSHHRVETFLNRAALELEQAEKRLERIHALWVEEE